MDNSSSDQCKTDRIKIFICLLIGGLCAAPDLWVWKVTELKQDDLFEEKTMIQCWVALEKVPETDLNVSVSAKEMTEEPEMDFGNLWLTEALPPEGEKSNIEKIEEIEEVIENERFTMREYRLFTIFVNFFLPVTIIISCYTAITIHLLDRLVIFNLSFFEQKWFLSEDFYQTSSNSILISLRQIFIEFSEPKIALKQIKQFIRIKEKFMLG